MRTSSLTGLTALTVAFAAGFCLGGALQPFSVARAQGGSVDHRVFEVRTYTSPEGKLDALHARFRDHTLRLFQKHGMTSVVYLKPEDAPLASTTLIYVLAHPSREAAKANWAAFQADPEWQKVKAESEAHGPITTKIESVFADPTDFSPMK